MERATRAWDEHRHGGQLNIIQAMHQAHMEEAHARWKAIGEMVDEPMNDEIPQAA